MENSWWLRWGWGNSVSGRVKNGNLVCILGMWGSNNISYTTLVTSSTKIHHPSMGTKRMKFYLFREIPNAFGKLWNGYGCFNPYTNIWDGLLLPPLKRTFPSLPFPSITVFVGFSSTFYIKEKVFSLLFS